VLDTIVNLESRRITHEAVLDLLARHPDLIGIYVAGGGMEGAISALRETVEPGRVQLVVNELTAESRAALRDGYATLVIATPLPALCGDLVGLMIAAAREGAAATVEQHFLEPRIILPDMV
jgi:LacI family transcriptional regulator